MKELTLIIPAKNEPESLPYVLKELEKLNLDFLIIMEESDFVTINAIEKFKSSFQYILNKKRHLKLIHFFLKNNMVLFSYFLFCIWHLTSSKVKKSK